jgi:hypothetical protein
MRLGLGCCVDHFLELLDGVKVLLDQKAHAHGVDRDMGRAQRLPDLQVAHRLLQGPQRRIALGDRAAVGQAYDRVDTDAGRVPTPL